MNEWKIIHYTSGTAAKVVTKSIEYGVLVRELALARNSSGPLYISEIIAYGRPEGRNISIRKFRLNGPFQYLLACACLALRIGIAD